MKKRWLVSDTNTRSCVGAVIATLLLAPCTESIWAGIPPADSSPGYPVNGLWVKLELPPGPRQFHADDTVETRLILKNIRPSPLIIHQDWAWDRNKGWSTGDPFHILAFVFDADGWPRVPVLQSSLNTAREDRGPEAFARIEAGGRLEKPFSFSLAGLAPGLYGLELRLQMTPELYKGRLDAAELSKIWTGVVASNRVIIEVVASE